MEIIGEKINTTRKDVQKAVRERDAAFIQELAQKQAEGAPPFLDVNSGLALYPEEEGEDFAWLVPLIQKTVDLPLCIDSGRPQPIEAALNLHRGKAMINSVNGDPAKMGEIFPLAKSTGPRVIALTSSREGGIPATSEERLKIAQAIRRRRRNMGFPWGISISILWLWPSQPSMETGLCSWKPSVGSRKTLEKQRPFPG